MWLTRSTNIRKLKLIFKNLFAFVILPYPYSDCSSSTSKASTVPLPSVALPSLYLFQSMFYTIVKVHFLTQNLKDNTSTMESFNSSLRSKSTNSYVNAKMANTQSSASLPPLPLWQPANRNAHIPIKPFSWKQAETSTWTKDHALPIAGIENRVRIPPLPFLYRGAPFSCECPTLRGAPFSVKIL